MADVRSHKYYCTRCDRYLYGETLTYLATAVNYHATTQHPADFANWTATNIESSTNYSGATGPLPQYLVSHGVSSKYVPTITDDDRAMLARGGVAW